MIGSGIAKMIEEALDRFVRRGIPAGALRDQVASSALPPAGNTGQGYTPDPDAVTRVNVRKNSTGSVYSRRRLNLIEGGNVTLTVADDSGNEEVDITIAAASGSTLTVEEVDGSPTDSAVTKIVFPNGTLGIASHVATYTPTGSDLLSLIYDQIANGTDDPIDFKITSGSYVVLGYFKGNSTSGWSSPTNAIHTVTTGKRFIVVAAHGSSGIIGDTGSRQARLRNTTDSTDVVGATFFASTNGAMSIPYTGDVASSTVLASAAASKALELQLWNTNTTKRAMGAFVIAREV